MDSLNVKFNVGAGECILHTTEVLNAVKTYFGENSGVYESLVENKGQTISLFVLCDADTQIDVRSEYGVTKYYQPLLEGTFSQSKNYVAQLISKSATTGLISISTLG